MNSHTHRIQSRTLHHVRPGMPLSLSPPPPPHSHIYTVFVTIYVHPASDSVVAPDMVVLTCQADGEPLPDIVWIKESADGYVTEFNASTLTSMGNITIEETIDGLNKTSTLRVLPTSALDTANYSCRAQNNVGILLSRTAEVTVYGKLCGNNGGKEVCYSHSNHL